MPVSLQAAAQQGHIGCTALLLRTALKQDDLANALLAAAKTGQQHILHLLLEAGQHAGPPSCLPCAHMLSPSSCYKPKSAQLIMPCISLRHVYHCLPSGPVLPTIMSRQAQPVMPAGEQQLQARPQHNHQFVLSVHQQMLFEDLTSSTDQQEA